MNKGSVEAIVERLAKSTSKSCDCFKKDEVIKDSDNWSYDFAKYEKEQLLRGACLSLKIALAWTGSSHEFEKRKSRH